jgi:hypothetical protein
VPLAITSALPVATTIVLPGLGVILLIIIIFLLFFR